MKSISEKQEAQSIYGLRLYSELTSAPALSIGITSRCPLRCHHCMTINPFRSRLAASDITPKTIKHALSGQHCWGFDTVEATGGEPFLRPDLLACIAAICRSRNLRFIPMTSAAWAVSDRQAFELLIAIRDANALAISVDKFHARLVPASNILTAIHAAVELGISRVVLVVTLEEFRRKELENLIVPFRGISPRYLDSLRYSLNTLVPAGLGKRYIRFSLNPSRNATRACRHMTGLSVRPDGYVYACCGPSSYLYPRGVDPLFLGHLDRDGWETIYLRYKNNPALCALRERGPFRILQAMEAAYRETIIDPRGYGSVCHVCMELLARTRNRIRFIKLLETIPYSQQAYPPRE